MLARFTRKEDRTQHGLMDQLLGDLPGKAHVNPGIDERFHHHKDVGRAGATQRRCHIDRVFRIHPDRQPHRVQDRGYQLASRLIDRW